MIDVPVVVNVWIRPENQKKQFAILKKARPKIVFLASDGPRNENEKLLIDESRTIVENIDWECDIYKIYENDNLGLYKMWKKTADFVFSTVDRCIFLEDDYVPSVSYFKFCAELLEKYKFDERILMINGMNHLDTYNPNYNDYFFAQTGSIWGIAFWKRTYENFLTSKIELNDYEKKIFENNAELNGKKRFIRNFNTTDSQEERFLGPEFNLAYIQITQNQLIIIPTKNMINNIGYGENAAHASNLEYSPKSIRKLFNMKTYEYDFPLRHPKHVIPDFTYTKRVNRIMGYSNPHAKFLHTFERVFYRIIHGNFKELFEKICKRL